MIEEEERSFGPFGTGVEPIHKSRKRRVRKIYIVCFLLAISIPIIISIWEGLHDNYLEKEVPKITLPDPPEGIGGTPMSFEVLIEDKYSGLDEIVIRYEQNGRLKDFDRILIKEPGVKKKLVKLEIDGPNLQLKQGEVVFSVVAFDKSFWNNSRKFDMYLTVDYVKPKIEVFTTQHNAVHGGSELVFYRLKDDKKKFVGFSGIKMGGWLFPGFEAKLLDEDFAAFPDLYFTFFPVPLDYNPDGAPIQLFARDGVGNVSSSFMYYRVRDFKVPSKTYQLEPEFLEERAITVYKDYLNYLASQGEGTGEYKEAENIEELVQRFRLLNVEYRRDVERAISQLLSKPRGTRYWSGRFARQSNFKKGYSFGELQGYVFEGIGAGSVLSGGVNLLAKESSNVLAANEGIVIYADFLGPYGEVVILDHGFGLVSFYANLKDLKVTEGKRVSRGEELAVVGNTGLFLKSGLHYEVRLHGVSVRPEEWWDKKWVSEHIDKKISSVKRDLGLKIRRNLK